ncbi:MAG: heme/hemin ABC transporter substrate-binding protein [Gibbsiella quercinecans]|uniref:heme/hemin ABC transporter substrate-binding protein n=1 Tax=Gibbsiella quercinecans TaxID=929813 RepID=UPI003F3B4895
MKRLVIALLAGWLCAAAQAQERLVVVGGSLVEIVYALGAGDRVVGVDQTTSYPPQTQALPHVGYWLQLSAEGLLALRPDKLITWQDAEPRSVLEQLRQQHVDIITLPRTPATAEQLLGNIRTLSTALGAVEKGQALINDISQRLATVSRKAATQPAPVKVLFMLSVGGGSPQVAGSGTVADGVLRLAGGRNVATHSQYRTYSGEAIIAADPDVIVVTTQSLAGGGGKKLLGNIPGVAQTAAWRNNHIVTIDQALILGMGPRIAQAAEQLYQGFYPASQ